MRINGVPDMTATYAGQLMPGAQVEAFIRGDRAFPTRLIRRAGEVHVFPEADKTLADLPIRSGAQTFDLFDYVSRNRVAGLLVLHRGQVAIERYELGFRPGLRWLSMSMAKSVAATLVGAAIHDGFIGGVEDRLDRYLPALGGSAYAGVTIRELLQMTSGVCWNDDQTDPSSERRHMLALQLRQEGGAIMDYLAARPRVAEAGTAWNYSTGETHVVGALVHAAAGQWLADYLSERIWSRLGMESDATWWLEAPGGLEVAGSGISATLGDYARFARFAGGDGTIDGTRVLPEWWPAEAGAARQVGGQRRDYGFMWWALPGRDGALADGAFGAKGIFGQCIYVNPTKDIVAVVLSARSKPKFAEAIPDLDFFNALVDALA